MGIWEHMDLQTGLLLWVLYVVWSFTETMDTFKRNHKPFEAEEEDEAVLRFPLGPAQLQCLSTAEFTGRCWRGDHLTANL